MVLNVFPQLMIVMVITSMMVPTKNVLKLQLNALNKKDSLEMDLFLVPTLNVLNQPKTVLPLILMMEVVESVF